MIKVKVLNKLAQIEPIDIRRDVVKETRSETKYIHHKLSGFVIRIVLFSYILRLDIKRTGKKETSFFHCMTMSFSVLIVMKDGPIPCCDVIGCHASDLTLPEINQEVSNIGNKVHDIGCYIKGDTKGTSRIKS